MAEVLFQGEVTIGKNPPGTFRIVLGGGGDLTIERMRLDSMGRESWSGVAYIYKTGRVFGGDEYLEAYGAVMVEAVKTLADRSRGYANVVDRQSAKIQTMLAEARLVQREQDNVAAGGERLTGSYEKKQGGDNPFPVWMVGLFARIKKATEKQLVAILGAAQAELDDRFPHLDPEKR